MSRVGKTVFAALIASSFLVAPVSVPHVQAQTLFDRLFPEAAKRQREMRKLRRERRLQRERARQDARKNRNRKTVRTRPSSKKSKNVRVGSTGQAPRVEGAKYYAYRAKPLQKVTFTKLAARLKKLDVDTQTTNSTIVPPKSYPDALSREFDIVPVQTIRSSSLMDHLDALEKVSIITEGTIYGKLVKHYENNPTLNWLDADGMPNEKAMAVLDYMANAAEEGFNPADYMVKVYEDAVLADYTHDLRTQKALEFELTLTARAARYMADAKHGRVDPNKISGYHDFAGNRPKHDRNIAKLLNSDDPVSVLKASHPETPAYAKLKNELSTLMAEEAAASGDRISDKTFIKPGQAHPELPKVIAAIQERGSPELIEKHAQTLAEYDGSQLYTNKLARLVAGFQKENKLGPDGIVGKNTLAKLQGISKKSRIQRVKMALERLRWHPSKLGNKHVFINAAAYRVNYMVNNQPQLSMRVVVGKPQHQTNFFHDTIETVNFNPYWNVPRSILINEFLPKLRRDPAWLDKRGYEVHKGGSRTYRSADIDWWSVDQNTTYLVRQLPGAKNALGEMKILFPNRHAIYMHDTPAKALFNHTQRAYSHGCVRLHDPRAMAAALLGTNKKGIARELAKSPRERAVKVPGNIPVYVSYFTAWPNAKTGEIEYFGDVYSRDKALEKAMKTVDSVRSVGRVKVAQAENVVAQ